jgi:hypothetical protein
MAAVPRSGPARVNSQPTRSYISMRAYNNDIFSYTVDEVDFNYVGTLGTVAGATALNCPQGRILVESGKKLYPGANPGILTYMVSVFDYATGLKGFIDPNSTAFTPQNTDRPYYITSPGSNSVDPNPDRAPPVFTRGNILAEGGMDLSGSALIYGNMSTIGATSISYGLTVANGVNVTSGQFNLHSGLVGVADMTGASVVGDFKKLTVTAPLCTASSHVFLTYAGINNPGVLSTEGITNGSFQIVSNNTSDAGNVRWLIIN